MYAKELKQTLVTMIEAGFPSLIVGPPGCGKSDIVAAAAEEAGAELILSHPVVSDPTDPKGLPAIVEGKAEFLPFGDLRKIMVAKKLTVNFLDDLGQAPAVVQAAYMQLILARQVGGHKISDKVVFIAATNRREDKAGVTGILEPVKSRFMSILNLVPSIDDWSEWALANNVPPELVAFVRFRPELFNSPAAPTNEIINRPSPRTITNLGKLYSAGLEGHEVLSGAVAQGFATEFLGFVKIFRSLPSIDGILLNPDTAAVPNNPAALYAVATALATRISPDNAGRVIKYLNRLPDEFGVLGIRDGMRACPEAQNTREFIKWATSHQGYLT